MRDTAAFTSDKATKDSPLREFIALLRNSFRTGGAVKNEWLMPFDPGPSTFKRPAMSGRSGS
jgi:hypothetical protein